MRNPPVLGLQRKMMLLSWQERSRWPQEEKGEMFVNPSSPPTWYLVPVLWCSLSPRMAVWVYASNEATPGAHFQGRGQQWSPVLPSPAGTAPSSTGHLPVPSLLDCWEARGVLGTSPSMSCLVAEPRTGFCVKPSLCSIIPALILPIPYFQCSIFFSLRKQLLLKPVFLAQFCVSFFSLRTLCVCTVQYCPLMFCTDFKENFPTSVMPHNFLFRLLFWFFAFCIWLQLCHAMRKL